MKKLIALFAVCIMLCGCANNMNRNGCSISAAYATGLHDAQYNKTMQSNFAALCPKKERAQVNDAYLQGYRYGLRHPTSVPPPYAPRSPQHYQQGYY